MLALNFLYVQGIWLWYYLLLTL